MSQDDLVIANQTFPATRSDINSNLQALGSLMSGSSAPSTAYAYMWWADTTNGVLKQRDAANSAWVIRATLSDDRVVTKTTTYSVALGDMGKTILCSASGGAFSVNLLAAATAGDGFRVTLKKTDSTTNKVTLDPNASETIEGATTVTLDYQYDSVELVCDGSNWHKVNESRYPYTMTRPTVTLASATTTDLGSVATNNITVSGTTTITGLGSSASLSNPIYFVRFSGALLLTHNGTSLIIPGAANITTVAGDSAVFEYLGSGNWRLLQLQRQNGQTASMTGAAVTVASATTCDIGTANCNAVVISGTTTITGLGSTASTQNPIYFVRFSGALTLTHNGTSLIIPGATNITTAAGDCGVFEYLGSGNWRVQSYQKASGAAVVGGGGAVIYDATLTNSTGFYVNVDMSSYKRIVLTFSGITKSTSLGIHLQFSTTVGSGASAGGTDYFYYHHGSSSTSSGGRADILIGDDTLSNGSESVVTIDNLGDANSKTILTQSTFINTSVFMYAGMGGRTAAAAEKDIRIFPSAGNFSGRVKVVGYA